MNNSILLLLAMGAAALFAGGDSEAPTTPGTPKTAKGFKMKGKRGSPSDKVMETGSLGVYLDKVPEEEQLSLKDAFLALDAQGKIVIMACLLIMVNPYMGGFGMGVAALTWVYNNADDQDTRDCADILLSKGEDAMESIFNGLKKLSDGEGIEWRDVIAYAPVLLGML